MQGNPASLLPARKWYEMLRACTSPDARARVALEFLRGGTGAKGGFLFQPRNGALVLTARTGNQPPPLGMLEDARRACDELRNTALDDAQSTGVRISRVPAASAPDPLWHAPEGELFERRPLGMHRDHQWIMVGLVMLRRDAGEELQAIRHTHIAAICNAILDAGDQ